MKTFITILLALFVIQAKAATASNIALFGREAVGATNGFSKLQVLDSPTILGILLSTNLDSRLLDFAATSTNLNALSNSFVVVSNNFISLSNFYSTLSANFSTASNNAITVSNRVVTIESTTNEVNMKTYGPGFNHGTWLSSNVYQLTGWKMTGAGTPWASSGTLGTNHNIRFFPFTSGNGGWFDCINWDTKSIGQADIGIYESRSWTNIEPYQLIASTGSNTFGSTGFTTHSTNFFLKPGRIYWVARGDFASSFQIGAPSTITGLQTEAPIALSLTAFSGVQPHTWEMVGCFSNALPQTFPTGFPIIGQTAALMAFPIAIKGN